jgi:hypothetical protein
MVITGRYIIATTTTITHLQPGIHQESIITVTAAEIMSPTELLLQMNRGVSPMPHLIHGQPQPAQMKGQTIITELQTMEGGEQIIREHVMDKQIRTVIPGM